MLFMLCPAPGFVHAFSDEIAFGFGVGIAIVFETFLQFDFQICVFIGFLRILLQILAENNFIIIAGITDVQVKNLIRKTLRCIAFAQIKTVFSPERFRHHGITAHHGDLTNCFR